MAAPMFRRICASCLKASKNVIATNNRSVNTGLNRFIYMEPKLASPAAQQMIQKRCVETTTGKPNSAISLKSVSSYVDKLDDEISLLPPDEGVVNKVNSAIQGDNLGRLFAVIHLAGSQYKITADDIIMVKGLFPPNLGDRIRLEKVLMVGSKDFTLLGRPMLNRDLVRIEATIIEKTLSVPKVWFNYIRRKGHRKFKLLQIPQTVLVINNIEVSKIDAK